MADLMKQGRWCPRASENTNDYLQVDMESVSLRFYKVDNNAKVRGQKLNELDVMNAGVGHPE